MQINELKVFIELEGEKQQLGNLLAKGNQIYFKISDTFLDVYDDINDGFHLSPFKIKHTQEIQTSSFHPFEGLFGLFSDSLPDAWGRLLLDRYLLSKGASNTITPLTRLAYVGNRGAGAISYEPILKTVEKDKTNIDLYSFYKESEKIIVGKESSILNEFYRLSGVSGGARPKINVGMNEETEELISFSTNLPENHTPWIVKFPSRYDVNEIAKVEYAYYLLAEKSGIEMAPSKLLKGENDTFFFATKRFDRIHNKKLHLHSLSGLLNDDFMKSNLDYGHLLDLAYTLTNKRDEYEKIFRVLIFNLIFCNQDDHSKNFSFLMDKKGNWRFSPAYDLTFSPSPYNYHSLSVAGAYQNVSLNDVRRLAEHFSMNNIEEIIEETLTVSKEWKEVAKNLDIHKSVIKEIDNRIIKK